MNPWARCSRESLPQRAHQLPLTVFEFLLPLTGGPFENPLQRAVPATKHPRET